MHFTDVIATDGNVDFNRTKKYLYFRKKNVLQPYEDILFKKDIFIIIFSTFMSRRNCGKQFQTVNECNVYTFFLILHDQYTTARANWLLRVIPSNPFNFHRWLKWYF